MILYKNVIQQNNSKIKYNWKLQLSMMIQKINNSRPDPGRREKISLIFYFGTSWWYLKTFYNGLTCFHKTFWCSTKECKNKNSSDVLF